MLSQMSVLQMHGTGTALGDPIEMNAALSAVSGPGSEAPLLFSAHKASCGHAEPSAGAIAGPIIALLWTQTWPSALVLLP